MEFFEDIYIGTRVELGAHTFSADQIKRFAGAYDPHPFQIDEDEAARSHVGRLSASGWHVLAVWMRLNVRTLEPADA